MICRTNEGYKKTHDEKRCKKVGYTRIVVNLARLRQLQRMWSTHKTKGQERMMEHTPSKQWVVFLSPFASLPM